MSTSTQVKGLRMRPVIPLGFRMVSTFEVQGYNMMYGALHDDRGRAVAYIGYDLANDEYMATRSVGAGKRYTVIARNPDPQELIDTVCAAYRLTT